MRKNTIIAALLLGGSSLAFAQTTQFWFGDNATYRKAKTLFFTETYLAANYEFENALENGKLNLANEEAATYYAALTSLINDTPGAEEQFLAFQAAYPKSVYTENGSWELGSFYLKKGDFDKAYKYLSQKNVYDLPERKRQEYQFKLGYVNLMKGYNDKALQYLEPLTQTGNYQKEANFYVGHIYYERREFAKALTYFDTLQGDPMYEQKILPYRVQIEFNEGQYDKAIEDGKMLLAQNRSNFLQSEVSKIVGESYFRQKNYAEAIPYLEKYQGKMGNADYYQLGYAYYEQQQYPKAISYFNKIVTQKSAWAQTAYYQLGNAYLKTNQKQEALAAYKAASEMDYNPTTQEDALYNYAKLSYDVGNPYQPTTAALQSFIAKYPNSKYSGEINSYLVDAFITSGNYQNALEILNKIPQKNAEQRSAEQLAAFLRGTELFSEGKLDDSQKNLQLAVNSNANAEITQRAYFWLGEIAYRKGQYSEAAKNFEKFNTYGTQVPESKEVNYQLGYTYLKLKQFDKSANAFKRYLASNPPGDFKADAKLRLADSYIGTQNNDEALSLYEEIASTKKGNADEAAYNRAVVIGIKGNTEEKAQALEAFIKEYPVSKFNDIAQLELADAYTQLDQPNKALVVLNNLIKTSKSELKGEARLRKGLIYYHQGKKNDALNEYKNVVKEFPRNNLAYQAIENAKRIYLDEGNYKAFEEWAKTIDFYEVNTSEIESLAYDDAMRKFDAKNYKEAIPLLSNFIAQYPQGNHTYAAQYALGESYYQLGDYAKAMAPLSEAAKYDNENKADALLRLAQIYLSQNKTTEALLTLENLHQITQNPAYISYAEIHLMQLYSKNGNHAKAVAMANKVLENPKNDANAKQEAELTKARSLMAENKTSEAQKIYTSLEQSNNPAVKAEALYYKAYFLNKEKKYKKSNEVIFELASKYAEQQLWGSQALVVMAENYYKLGDLYQANFTLDSVIENYQDYPEVIAKAKALKKQIKK
ncbi:tetratricopeptide repeat protein [Ornithobacterium rhinotracheale]|uniref:tetratricopeptide repeat protein n=1 Tax=Ornithobacterium rhinotracheale TaxID=28251 RepID=UPI00403572CA